jgi:uncharacterized protein YggU (UPF0235/DUF167 family)
MALIFELKVTPSAGRQAWQVDKSGLLKCFLKSVPENGKANQELIKLLAAALRLPTSAIIILTGETGRRKRVKVTSDLTYDQLLQQLNVTHQTKLF